MASQITSRRATLADLPQCCEILNYYILNTSNTFTETPISLVDFAERYRRVLEQGYPFLVLVPNETPHKVVGYYYSPFGTFSWIAVPTSPLTHPMPERT
jgi:L-amino acid N-acyltransferase YncA